jgi:hypothetical protein
VTPPRVPRPVVSVRGGADGIEAHLEQITAAARHFGHVATDVGGSALALHGYLLDPALATTALLDPGGMALFEADLADALDGPHGLSWIAARAGALDVELRAAVIAYRTADEIGAEVRTIWRALEHLPAGLKSAFLTWASSGGTATTGALEALLARDPELVDLAMQDGLLSLDAVLAHSLPDGHAKVRDTGMDDRLLANSPPRDLADLMAGLSLRDQGRHGEIDVKILTCADGTRRVIVDIPGTKSWDPLPNGDVTSFSTNARALIGERTAYEQGVLAALTAAGVTPRDEVMLVGHSEGGMVAVTAARDAVRSGRFNVTHVITAGSPIALSVGRVPSRVQVLALENEHDFVPHLDGRANPDLQNVTTVEVEHGDGSEGDDHSIPDSYLPGAVDAGASDNASIRDFLAGARKYFSASSVTTHTYVITRAY